VQRYETAHERVADDESDSFNGNLGKFDPLWIEFSVSRHRWSWQNR
jgi:hypothetical protein